MDITYITMARGFVYLAVVLDWFSRRALSWLSITMEAAFCVETLEDALWLVTANRTSLIPIRVRWADSLQHLYGGKLRWASGDGIPIEQDGLYCVHQGGRGSHNARNVGGSGG
jgi:transposase InsO family protein